MEIALNPRARFHDGTPITASDVAFTFHKFMTEGVPQFRLFYKGTTVKAIAPLTVRIDLGQPGKENMLSLLSLPVMPEAFWRHHKLSDPLSKPPLASGPIASPPGGWGSILPIPGSPTTGRPTCRSTAGAGISIRCAMTIISTTTSL
jgi:ABC-type transport system substrate-binding protein